MIKSQIKIINGLCFHELNVFGPNNTPSPDLRLDLLPEPEPSSGCLPFFSEEGGEDLTIQRSEDPPLVQLH